MSWTELEIQILRQGLEKDLSFAAISKQLNRRSYECIVAKARSLGLRRKRSVCPLCNKRRIQSHANAYWCKPCAEARRKRPYANLEQWQKDLIHKHDGKISLERIGELTKTSKATVTRYRRMAGLSLRSDAYSDKIVKDVCAYYFVHGKIKTRKKFPKVKLRSIIERHYAKLGYPPRQEPWTDEQLIMLAKMAGLVSMDKQAAYFNRPNARVGSIRAAWIKKFHAAGGQINGLSCYVAKHYVRKECFITTQFWWQRHHITSNPHSRKIVLWVDLEKNLKPDVPEHLRSAISALAKFQRWLHGRNVRANIRKMIEEVNHVASNRNN